MSTTSPVTFNLPTSRRVVQGQEPPTPLAATYLLAGYRLDASRVSRQEEDQQSHIRLIGIRQNDTNRSNLHKAISMRTHHCQKMAVASLAERGLQVKADYMIPARVVTYWRRLLRDLGASVGNINTYSTTDSEIAIVRYRVYLAVWFLPVIQFPQVA